MIHGFPKHGGIVGRVFEHVHEQRSVHGFPVRPCGEDCRTPAVGSGRRGVGGVDAQQLCRGDVREFFEESQKQSHAAADVRDAGIGTQAARTIQAREEQFKFRPIVPMSGSSLRGELPAFDDIHIFLR